MNTTTVTIHDADRNVDYELKVLYGLIGGVPPRMGWLNGGDPGEAQGVEINRVRCTEVTTWCGDYAVSAYPAGDSRESLEWKIGAWCLEKYRAKIVNAVSEQVIENYRA